MYRRAIVVRMARRIKQTASGLDSNGLLVVFLIGNASLIMITILGESALVMTKSRKKKIWGTVGIIFLVLLIKGIINEYGKEYADEYVKKTLKYESGPMNERLKRAFGKIQLPFVIDEHTKLMNFSVKNKDVNLYFMIYNFDENNIDYEFFKQENHKELNKDSSQLCGLLEGNEYVFNYIYYFEGVDMPPIIIKLKCNGVSV